MKIKFDFITNSSSANFSINKKYLSNTDIFLIKNHIEIAYLLESAAKKYAGKHDYWTIEETEYEIKGHTSMTNFDMEYYHIHVVKVDWENVEYEQWG